MKLFTPFTIPQKDNCDLCRGKTNKRREVENPFLDQLFKFLYRDKFDFVFDWPWSIKMRDIQGQTIITVLWTQQ